MNFNSFILINLGSNIWNVGSSAGHCTGDEEDQRHCLGHQTTGAHEHGEIIVAVQQT